MKSSNIMTLFSEQPRPRTGPSSFVISLVVHLIAAALILAMRRTPRTNEIEVAHMTVRLLKAQNIELRSQRAANSESEKQPEPLGQTPAAAHEPEPGSGAPAASAPPQLPQIPRGQVTLVQPDAPIQQLIAPETPIPLVMLWAPENTPSKVIVAPPHQEPTITETRPAIIKPNREPKISDLNITTTPFTTQLPLLPPGSTSPVVVRRREEIKQIPSTSTATLESPTPAQVLSISPLKADGAVVIPYANQASQAGTTAGLTASAGKGSGNSKDGQSASLDGTATGTGAGSGSVKGPGASNSTGSGTQPGGATAGKIGNGSVSGQDGDSSRAGLIPGVETPPGTIRITLPKDGQFGVVVVGTSLAEQYPEIVGVWTDRVVYTVYLHVGTRKNWILQYSVAQTAQATASGNTSRPDAPWPYDILRPKLNPADYNTDAVMVHGFVNPTGRFENLALVFPAGFSEAKFILNTLQQWRFRPARQNGNDAAVEVLLIIPEEPEE